MRTIGLLLLGAALAAQTGNDRKEIRRWLDLRSNTVRISRFQDLNNTCYVAESELYSGVVTTISCVKQ